MQWTALVILISFLASFNVAANGKVDLQDAGADLTGEIACTKIINAAIDSLHLLGGGEVYFPAGNYLSGPIKLKSNITLNLEAGAILKFSDNFDDYLPMVTSRWEGIRVKTFQSPISAYNATNITIKGRGMIDGNGKKWWDIAYPLKRGEPSTNTKWEQMFSEINKDLIDKNPYLQKVGSFLRPPMIMPYECENVRIEGLTLKNPAFWTIMPAFSNNITIDGITIINPEESPNTDGIDPSSCRNVHISNCHISVGDDCIVIKSGRDEDGREANSPTENITITNCTMLDGHGGVVIGSEMSGSVRRVTISNCVFQGTDRGIRIKTMRGRGGYVEDIQISNIVMYDMLKQGIMMNMRYHPTPVEEVSERTPTIRNVSIANIRINKAKQAIAFFGLEERSIENITISDVSINANQGIFGEYAKDIDLSNIRIQVDNGIPVEFNQSENLTIKGLTIKGEDLKLGAVQLSNVNTVLISECFQVDEMPFYLKLKEDYESIYFINNILPGVSKATADKNDDILERGSIIGKQ